jgi:carboxypeptidase Q
MLSALIVVALWAPGNTVATASSDHASVAARIRTEALRNTHAYARLQALCDDIGHRLSGSAALERAVVWARDTLAADGQEGVRLQAVQVPKWVRGVERARMVEPMQAELAVLGLGFSVGTPPEGLTAEVLVATDEAAFEALGDRVKGRMVLFDNPMPEYDPKTGSGYGKTVRFRIKGARMVAAQGGVAALVRSVTAHSLRTPHTGTQGRVEGKPPPVPAVALSTEDAEHIHRLVKRGKTVKVHLTMGAHLDGEATSHNVIAELRGRELPDEIVLVGAHLDSWDVGQGAHDDGGGVIMAMETLRILKALNLRPRRTIRAVLFTNEENGLRGAIDYAEAHRKERHVAAIESDSGAFAPKGYRVEHADAATAQRAIAILQTQAGPLLAPLGPGADRFEPGFSGADVRPLKPSQALLFGLAVDGAHYFDVHHTAADTVDKVVPAELAANVASMATLAWLLAELPALAELSTVPGAP